MKGSFCHVVQKTLRLPNQNQTVAKGVSCGTEWLFLLIMVCTRLEYLNQDTSAPERSKPALCTLISLILPCLLLVTTARVLRLGNSTWALSEGKASGIAQIRQWKTFKLILLFSLTATGMGSDTLWFRCSMIIPLGNMEGKRAETSSSFSGTCCKLTVHASSIYSCI